MWLPLDTTRSLDTATNLHGDQSTGELKISTEVVQVAIMELCMILLDAVRNRCDNNSSMGWTKQLYNLHSDYVGDLLHTRAFTLRDHCVTSSIV